MASLVPYAASAMSNPHTQAMAVDLAGQIVNAVTPSARRTLDWATGPRRSRKAKRPVNKNRARRNLFDVGRPENSNPNRRAIRESGVTSIANKELFDEPLIQIEKNVAGDEQINKRNRDTVNYKGTKICFMFKSILKVPVFLNWAIVTPKRLDAINSTDFLRDGSTERDMPVSNAATFLDLRCAPINTDRYRVLMHERHTILPDSDKNAAVQSEGRDLKIIEKYIPLKRQVFFDGDSATPLTNVYMVWWCDFFNSTTGGVTNLTADVTWRMIQYYQDIP